MSQNFFTYLQEQLATIEKSIEEAKKIIAFSKDIGQPLLAQETELKKLEAQKDIIKKALAKYVKV